MYIEDCVSTSFSEPGRETFLPPARYLLMEVSVRGCQGCVCGMWCRDQAVLGPWITCVSLSSEKSEIQSARRKPRHANINGAA